MAETEYEKRSVKDVETWDYRPQYARQMWVRFTDGAEVWISMDCRLADEIYASDIPAHGANR